MSQAKYKVDSTVQMISKLRSDKCANLSAGIAITMSQSDAIIYLYL